MKPRISVYNKNIWVKADILNVNKQIILVTNKHSNILLAIIISLAASVIHRHKKFIQQAKQKIEEITIELISSIIIN